MNVVATALHGILVIQPTVHADDRGFFLETFSARDHAELGITDLVQDNQSRSGRGTIRGLHYQRRPGQSKLVRVARGRVWDVVVDIRPASATFGQHAAFELDDVAHRQLYVPVGFAHGFCVLSDVADVVYRVGSYYDPAEERGLAWDDPQLGIEWPLADPLVSDRDRSNPTLAEALGELRG